MLQCVAVCCSLLQCVAVCCSVLQCVAVCCSSQEAEYNLIFRLAGGTKAVRHLAVLADPPSKIQMWPQRAVACRGTSESGGGTGNATHAIISSSQTSAPKKINVIMPPRPTPPTCTLQLFLNSLFFLSPFS